jgi:hypothetical protein
MPVLRLPVIAAQCVRVSIAGSRTTIVSQLTLASGSRRRRLGHGDATDARAYGWGAAVKVVVTEAVLVGMIASWLIR